MLNKETVRQPLLKMDDKMSWEEREREREGQRERERGTEEGS